MARSHSDIQELLGAYALHALNQSETNVVDKHLPTCPRCRAEVQDHRETAAMLAHAGAEAPSGLWDRIAAELEAEPPPDIARVLPLRSPVREKQSRFSGPGWRRAAVAAAAAAAALIAVDTALIVRDRSDKPSVAELAGDAAAASGSRLVTMRSVDGRHSMSAVVTKDGRGYVMHGRLTELDDERTYQLWGIVEGREPVSLGVLGRNPKSAAFTAAFPISQLAVTIEPRGGAATPSTLPVLSGKLTG